LNHDKKIKHISELPKWFDLNNYTKVRTLSMYDWHVQLVFRKHCLDCPNMSALAEPIAIMREKTVIKLADHHHFNLWYGISCMMNIQKFVTTQENNAISSLTMRNFFNIEKFLLLERKTYQPELADHVIDIMQFFSSPSHTPTSGTKFLDTSDGLNFNTSKQEWMNEPIYKSALPELKAEGLINVNLDYSDDILIEQFKKWLSAIRVELDTRTKSKAIKQADLNSWALYGVLPYLDLKIWERETNLSIPNRVMADAIYLRGVGGEETVRKTTTPLVEQLLSDKILNQLGGQVVLQKPEQNPA